MSEIKKVWQCVVCGRAWDNNQSLRAHMKAHKSEQYFATKIVVPRPLWQEFKQMCEDHKTTTCQVVKGMVEGVIASEKKGIPTILSPNPIIIQVNHVSLGAPRGRYSHFNFDGLPLLEALKPHRNSCPECGSRNTTVTLSVPGNKYRECRCKACGANFNVDPQRAPE